MLDDQQARITALDPTRSFIVRAPAGSGKTELLIQRFLVLLANVESPEQIVAITFTRKAAAEMRERIIKQLQLATKPLAIDAPLHQQLTWRLARSALDRDQHQQWRLLQQPERLRLVTIDALCADFVRQLPLVSGLMHVRIHQQPHELYTAAIQAMFNDLDESMPWQSALITLLKHCDNRLDHLSALCQALLAQREQWLPLMQAAQENSVALKKLLECNFQALVLADIASLDASLSELQKRQLLPRLAQAASLALKNSARYHVFLNVDSWPTVSIENQNFWQALGQFLLTEEGSLRKRLDSNGGFPPATKAPDAVTKQDWQHHKASMQALLMEFAQCPDLVSALQNCAIAPTPLFDEQEWPLCSAIFSLFTPLLVYWRLTCEQYQQVDFSEVSWRARMALGDRENPSDLALQIDYHVHHWLLDEFQDTSLTQFELLKALTAGWQAHDGRTVFLVGDPLQSIYRFRQAEVSLFWQVWAHGLADLPVQALALTRNFRSQAGLITWFNRHFSDLFPLNANWQVGAVPYTSVTSVRQETLAPAVITCQFSEERSEVEHLIALLQEEIARNSHATIAILVKARSHLTAILPALQRHAIAYRAVELAALSEQPVVQDCVCLLRALLNRDDRLAWAGLLRAPWGGNLDLADWHALLDASKQSFVWPLAAVALSREGQANVQRIEPLLTDMMAQRHRQSLTQCWQVAWQALGAADYWSSPVALAAFEKFLHLLMREEQAGDLLSLPRFERLLASTYLEEVAMANVDIMTIHKAKGLEFDVVILPGLTRRQAIDEMPLFVFDSISSPSGPLWLLAPMKAAHVKAEPRYDFLRYLQKQKRAYEQQRLYYVACTRARERLYLFEEKV